MKNNIWSIVLITSLCSSLFTMVCVKYLMPKAMLQSGSEVAHGTYITNLATPSAKEVLDAQAASPPSFSLSAEIATPTVVNIKASADFLSSIWNTYSGSQVSTGSGVIISVDGFIVTNKHVIEDNTQIEITLNDKRKFQAKLIGFDASTDLALLQMIDINGQKFPFAKFADSDKVRIGEWVLAVGNPFNLTSTVTAGIVSAKARNIDILNNQYAVEAFIQTDAVVNPGNSGGALVNMNGDLIGINTAIITRSGKYEGYSFAVPSNLVAKVVDDLRKYGIVQRGILGVEIQDITDELSKLLQLESSEGVLVKHVTSGSGADKGGLKAQDFITHINGTRIRSMPSLQEQVARLHPGDVVALQIIRNGKSEKKSIKLSGISTNYVSNADSPNLSKEIGFEMRDLNADEMKRIKTKGALVVHIYEGSKISKSNMDKGYIITKVNSKPVSTSLDVLDAINKSERNKIILEGFYEGYKEKYYYSFEK